MEATKGLPYPSYVHRYTNPLSIAGLARIMNFPAVDPERANILEMGCAFGTNLLEYARLLPRASFTGIDIDARAIEKSIKSAKRLNVKNASFICTAEPLPRLEGKSFDYIIMHGLFSWVIDDIKESLLTLCQQHLSPNGIAYISYNTFPGWLYPMALRDFNLPDLEPTVGKKRVQAAHQFLDDLSAAVDEPARPYSHFLKEEMGSIRNANEHYLYHDYLADTNDPCYFLQFAEWADEFGLAYLMDANPAKSFLSDLSESAKKQLSKHDKNPLKQQQLVDFITNRHFRSSLLIHQETLQTSPLQLAPEKLEELHLRLPEKPNRIEQPDGITYAFSKAIRFTLNEEWLIQWIDALSDAFPHTLPAHQAVQQFLAKHPEGSKEEGLPQLFKLYACSYLEAFSVAC